MSVKVREIYTVYFGICYLMEIDTLVQADPFDYVVVNLNFENLPSEEVPKSLNGYWTEDTERFA